jgi:hypothetical protein
VSADAQMVDGVEETLVVAGESPLPEGVEGGVVGGVVGGVAGGVPGGVPSPETTQPVEVPASAPPPPARIAEPGERTRQEAPRPVVENERRAPAEPEAKENRGSPYTGRFDEVMQHLAAGRVAPARELAEAWSLEAPGDVLALLALGESWEAAGEKAAAARAYGSLIDLFPSRVDLRRLAGERLERLGEAGLDLAIDTYRKAALDRPDHPSSHRLLAWALLRAGRTEEAFEALETGLNQTYPGGRFAGVGRVLREDLGLVAAAWLRAKPADSDEVIGRLQAVGARLEDEPSLRFVLSWETDANDVDLHVVDPDGEEVYYSHQDSRSGLELYEDVTQGLGPEVVRTPKTLAGTYHVGVRYFAAGPMGISRGVVIVTRGDDVQIHPFRLAKGGEEIRYVAGVRVN